MIIDVICCDCGFGSLDEHTFKVDDEKKGFSCPKCEDKFIIKDGVINEVGFKEKLKGGLKE